ncbi:helix-turn-helix domain-containing protein [Chitinophaga rhizophila]|uniref:AraC family transcriptional regulator n=1 Tax=Chitinophaga rhizophila TaxID=2866212 RepID=A0ABS7GK97_9BACT|nr:AraC family transcriptional regulator [Chitinophaga rhizophila]MBW8688150.1 AraC family transcriptional regulator [Chitinophaga rhizophila]
MTLPLSISTQIGQPILFTPGLPDAYSSYTLQGTKPYYAVSDSFGCILFQQVANNHYQAWVSHYIINKPTAFKVKGNVDDLLLHHTLKGSMFYELNGMESETFQHQMNIIVTERLRHTIRFKSPGLYVALEIQIPKEELRSYQDSFPIVQELLNKLSNENTITLLDQHMIAHERLRNIIQDITERQLPKAASEKYREQKTGEFIIESLDMLSRYLTDANGLSAADHERGQRTEVHLLKHLQQPSPPTLKQLARFAGTNEKKLEEIFRSRHGITVYDFFQNARMRIIYRKLTETTTPLQDLAEEFGYTDYSSFSYAVKKRFSLSPRELRKNSSISS